MKRRLRKEVLAQIKQARAAADEAGEEWETNLGDSRRIEYIEPIIDIKNAAVNRRRELRNSQLSARRAGKAARREYVSEQKITSQWYFNPGELVQIKPTKNTRRMSQLPHPVGTIAVIVDTVNHTNRLGVENKAATITVMVNGKIENWDASWVKHCE